MDGNRIVLTLNRVYLQATLMIRKNILPDRTKISRTGGVIRAILSITPIAAVLLAAILTVGCRSHSKQGHPKQFKNLFPRLSKNEGLESFNLSEHRKPSHPLETRTSFPAPDQANSPLSPQAESSINPSENDDRENQNSGQLSDGESSSIVTVASHHRVVSKLDQSDLPPSEPGPPATSRKVSSDFESRIQGESSPDQAPLKMVEARAARSVLEGSKQPVVDSKSNHLSQNSPHMPESPIIFVSSDPAKKISSSSSLGTGSLAMLVEKALDGHPKIKAARHRIESVRNQLPQVTSLPDPTFNNVFWPIQKHSLQTAAGRVGNQMSLNQGVPWPQKRQTKALIIEKQVKAEIAKLRQIESEIEESVKLAYFDLWLSVQSIEIKRKTRQILEDLIPIVEARYRSGGSQRDVLRARISVARFDQQIANSEQQREVALAVLADLTQERADFQLDAPQNMDIGGVAKRLDQLIAIAEKNNPELKSLGWQFEKAKQNVELAKLQQRPDLQFGLHWGLVNDNREVLSGIANGNDLLSFNVGTSLPLWGEKNRAAIREANNLSKSSVLELDARRNQIISELRRLRAQVESLTIRRNIYSEKILPRLVESLQLCLADYRGSRVDFGEVTDIFVEQLMVETEIVRMDASIASTLATLEKTVGLSGSILKPDAEEESLAE